MWERKSPDKKEKKKEEKKSQHGTCKRKSPQKIKANKGCVRETPTIKMKSAWDV